MSDTQACSLAAAFAQELKDADAEVASSKFLCKLQRLSETGHEYRLTPVLQTHGLYAAVNISWLPIGLAEDHPVLRVQDFLACLSKEDKVSEIFLQNRTFADFEEFWARYRHRHPHHPVYDHHQHRLRHCVPLYLHCDEGTGPKKKGLLIMQFQCIMGKGSRRAADLNLAGSTYVTRLLYTVLRQHHYNRQKSVLYKLLQHWVNDWKDAFHDGICVSVAGKSHTIYPIVLGLKGDWPALIKMGRLNRHFGRDAPASQNPPGICHLCRAGRLGFPWHLNDINAAWLLDPHAQDVEPWNAPSPLVEIPSDSGASFYMIDVFHTLHKGVFGDFAASALDP